MDKKFHDYRVEMDAGHIRTNRRLECRTVRPNHLCPLRLIFTLRPPTQSPTRQGCKFCTVGWGTKNRDFEVTNEILEEFISKPLT